MSQARLRTNARSAASGFSLIEVLVAVLVLSIGLLGMAGLQTTGLRFNTDAYYMTQATWLANDLVERMRSYASDRNVDGAANDVDVYATTTPATGICQGKLASDPANDLRCWLNAVADTLPVPEDGQSSGEITQAGTIYTITVRWADRNDRDAQDVAKTIAMSLAVDLKDEV